MIDYRLPSPRMAKAFSEEGIREIVSKAEALEKAGKKIIHMEIGRPDYDSPACAKKAAIQALERGDVHYTNMSGTPELRGAIADAMKRDYGMTVDPEREVVVTVGAMEALTASFLTLLEPGDEVIVPTPFFPAYAIAIALAHGVLKEVPCRLENGFRPDAADIEAAITPKTRLILINTPNNPSGAVMRQEDLEAIAKVAQEHDLLVLSDECYEKFLYEGKHISIATLPGMRERTLILSAASKTFSMTGWRIGWIISPPEMKLYLAKHRQHLTTCANSFAQAGVAEALRSAEGDVARMIAGYKERRDFFVNRLKDIPGFEVHMPQGAFYAFPRVAEAAERRGMNTAKFAAWLLEEAGVATVPGEVFHAQGTFLRMAYCRPLEELAEAADRIEAALKS